MKKLSQIMESVWSDIQDRSTGNVVRKEDAINKLNRNDFYEYLKSRYDKLSHRITEDPSGIHMGLGWSYFPKHEYTIVIHWVENHNIKKLYINGLHVYGGKDELYNLCKRNFITCNTNDNITNEEIIEIIDFILDYMSKHTSTFVCPMFESVWSDIQDRSAGEVKRKEDGSKVTTCLGTKIFLKNPQCHYDEIIKSMFDKESGYELSIENIRQTNITPDEMVNVRKWEAPYVYLIYEGGHGTDLLVDFYPYTDILDWELDDQFEDDVVEDDYISICKGVATKLKEIGDCFVYIPLNKGYTLNAKHSSRYGGDYELLLVDESTVYNWLVDVDDEYMQEHFLDEFRESMINEFPELAKTDFIIWTYQGGCNIGIPMFDLNNINNIMNIRKYREFAEKWFKTPLDESVWSDIQDRSTGDQIRKEDIPEQDYVHYWKSIPLDNVPKYKKEELRLWDFIYDLVVWKVEKAMNISKPKVIRIFFRYEDAWYLSIYHNTSHGVDNYTMEAQGTRSYSPIKYSDMNINEKRSIKYRLEKKKFYVYKYSYEYVLREEPEYNGQKGILLK